MSLRGLSAQYSREIRRLLCLWSTLIAGHLVQTATGNEIESTKPIDTAIILEVGGNTLSAYALEKNFARGAAGFSPQAFAASAQKHWFEVFLAKQVFIAEAFVRGYNTRSEVLHDVEAMERYMLSQSRSTTLPTSKEAISEERLNSIHHQLGIEVEVVGVRLPNARMLIFKGDDWAQIADDVKLRRLTDLANSEISFFRGPLPWPYIPFPELELELSSPVVASTWVEHRDPAATTLLYIVSSHCRCLPPFQPRRAQFETFTRDRLRERDAFLRRSVLLESAGIQIDRDVAVKLAERLSTILLQVPEVSKDLTATIGDAALVRYLRDGLPVTMTVEDWRVYYNRQFVRRIPNSVAALSENIREMISADLEVLQARKSGADQSPQFVEDRQNFLHYQALDLYEKEILLPQIVVSEEELRAYYALHLGAFSEPVGAKCVSLRFGSEGQAQDWLKGLRGSLESSLRSGAILEKSEIRVSHETPFPQLPGVTDAILHLPEHAAFGPISSPVGWIVVFKHSTEAEPSPYERVANQIRALVVRKRIDEKELELAGELAKKFKVYDRIPYAKFGLPDTLVIPWLPRP